KSAPRDDQRDADRQYRVEPRPADVREGERRERHQRDENVTARVRRVSHEKDAAELAASPALVPDDEYVDDKRSDDEPDIDQTDVMRRPARQQRVRAFAQQLETRYRQKPDDSEGAEGLELVVA